jgi:peptidoglycan L-alanyl-D-glutamate endopeptidase CwlK
MSNFTLGANSLKELNGVHPDLVAVVKRALELSAQDFAVHDGIRTLAEQQQFVASGASQTLDSRHLSGHAVDLVPYINGKLRWEWPPIYTIAEAVRKAANELNIPIRWGGAWDVPFADSTGWRTIMSPAGKKPGKKHSLTGRTMSCRKINTLSGLLRLAGLFCLSADSWATTPIG